MAGHVPLLFSLAVASHSPFHCTCVSVRRRDRFTRTFLQLFASATQLRFRVFTFFVLVCLSADVTGALVLLSTPPSCFVSFVISTVLVCLSADVTGALVLLSNTLFSLWFLLH